MRELEAAMEKELATRIGTMARRARKELGLTQADLAERIDVSVEFYARIERGRALPSVETFALLVCALGVSADVLLGMTRDDPPEIVPASRMSSSEPPELRRVVRRLRKADRSAMRLVGQVLDEIDHRAGHRAGHRSGAAR